MNYFYLLADTTMPDCQVEEQKPSRNKHINNLSKINIKKGVLIGSIPSIVADSVGTSNVGAKKDKTSGRTSDKVFQLPNGTRTLLTPSANCHMTFASRQKISTSFPPSLRTPYSASQRWWTPDTSTNLMMKK